MEMNTTWNEPQLLACLNDVQEELLHYTPASALASALAKCLSFFVKVFI